MKAKNNNKGFSFVELVVMILIIAILAVALAPQVMKWVDGSRIARDKKTMQSLVTNCQLALAKEEALTAAKDKEISVNGDGVVTGIGKYPAETTSLDAFWKNLATISDVSEDSVLTAYKTKATDNVIIIKIDANGTVTGSMTKPNDDTTHD